MTITKRLVQTSGLVAGVVAAIAAASPDTPVGDAARRLTKRLARDVRYAVASAPGILYRLAGQHPDPGVDDDVLADRIRSTLGPLEKRLDVPRVHVIVEDHVAILHGDVVDRNAAKTIEYATMHVSGVEGVESHLHAGLLAGDTRPSDGRRVPPPPSDAMTSLLNAARGAGADGHAHAAVHAVLCAFLGRVPADERAHVESHLPQDVRALAGPPRHLGEKLPRPKTVPQLVAAATAEGGIDTDHAEAITRAVISALHDLAPDEARSVAAVLPSDLRDLWEGKHQIQG